MMYSDVAKIITHMRKYDKVKYDEYIAMSKTSEVFDSSAINNISRNTCKSTTCPNICKNHKDSCDGYYFAKGEWVKCEEFYLPDITNLSIVVHEFTSTMNGLRESGYISDAMNISISNAITYAKRLRSYVEELKELDLEKQETQEEIQKLMDTLSNGYLEVCKEYAVIGKIRTVNEIFDLGIIIEELNKLLDVSTRHMVCRNVNYPCRSLVCNYKPKIAAGREVVKYITKLYHDEKLSYDEYLELYIRMVLNDDMYMRERVQYIATLLTSTEDNHIILSDTIKTILKEITVDEVSGYHDNVNVYSTLEESDEYSMKDGVIITSKNT